MYWQNTLCLCTHDFRLVKQLLNCCRAQTHNRSSHVWHLQSLVAWQSWAKLSHQPPPPSLSSCLAHTHQLLLPCSLIHLPAWLQSCHVSRMRQPPTNEMWWERLRSVVGTLLPSLVSLSTWEPKQPQGGAALSCCLNEHQTKTLTNRWVTRVSVGFSRLYSLLLPPHHYFSFMAGTLLCILAGLGKKRTQRNKTVKVWELFLVPFFPLSGSFISLNSAYTGIWAPVVLD